ncbi:SDR family NAD(P)-dependent oxidoreductase [Jeotgalibacillus proteolyticus]|uniref:Short-chain dehydrogenase n=1 Tax=Jeotgalibacillus proteolyticus TaxID=2082395 RepID=A0A2S5GB19_9BACL|nr:SDR family oxidoreductase [Jeotgalibacillus proteolyticus]PPA70115.1 short-chain dehydrogenase [Jeotgalibacillus proteolyticus]
MTVLITGASSGIGESLAVKYAMEGHPLIITARNKDRLDVLASTLIKRYGVAVTAIESDLSSKGSALKLFNKITQSGLTVEVLINNAGVGLFGEFHKTDMEKEEAMIQLNITSLTELTKLFGREMVKKGEGKVLNIASTAAFFPGPLMSVYYASKAYVKSFSHALSNEWREHGVQVSVLCPGPTGTGFKDAAELGDSKLFQKGIMSVEAVTEHAYKEFTEGKEEIIPGAMNRIQTRFGKFISSKKAASIVRKTQERV